ncbi:MAG: type I restriction endonuclease subunit R [Spartobacteria bacterium]|nr:type I restriction endonuclease subunit R [Spartobacteria bacterium]
MRQGLPNAQYLAFTGTPLLGKGRKTNAWFGDYVSEYNFSQSTDDGATVPLFYKKRVPEVLIHNEDLSAEFCEILEDENLDEAQQAKLEKRFAKETEVIIRDDRLDTIADDIVYHFPRRGYLGKGMVIVLDKFTAVKMYDKVDIRWKKAIKELTGRISKTDDEQEKKRLKTRQEYMRRLDMAVVVSEQAGEDEKFEARELNIKRHRERLQTLDKQGHDVEYKFKDPEDPLQLVFVCAMWLTGFDVPTLSTLYLDKPMRDHTLMQAITRANRVSSVVINGVPKKNGEVVDYYNVFRNMKKALADYGNGDDEQDEQPTIQEKEKLFTLLDDAIREGLAFCDGAGVHLPRVLEEKEKFNQLRCFHDFANTLLETDERRKTFVVYDNTITALYEACKPEILKEENRPMVDVFQYLRGVIDRTVQQSDITSACHRISDLLDQSVVTDKGKATVDEALTGYQIVQRGKSLDLSKVDFDKLKTEFQAADHKNIKVVELRSFIEKKLENMLKQNVTRADFAQRMQEIIDGYNAGCSSTENYYDDLMNFAEDLKEEDERHIREGLTVDELELFDLLKKESMTADEKQRLKLAARDLLRRLLEEQPNVLVQDWFRDEQSKLKVKHAVEVVLDKDLPESYDRALFNEKCEAVFNLVYEYACSGRKWCA